MELLDLLATLRENGVSVRLDKDRLKVSSSNGTIPAALLQHIRDMKPGLVSFLSQLQEKKALNTIVPTEKKEYYTLSSAQARIYFMQHIYPESMAYNEWMVVLLEEDTDVPVLVKSFQQLISVHECLRTRIIDVEGVPMQQVLEEAPFSMAVYDARHEEEVEAIIRSFRKPFDLSKAPFIRAGVIRIKGQSARLLIDVHHIITDNITKEILLRDIRSAYQGNVLSNNALQYKDYSEWQFRHNQKNTLQQQQAWWLEHLSGTLPVMNLPLDHERPVNQSFEGAAVQLHFKKAEWKALKAYCAVEGLTTYMMQFAALSIFLHKITGQEDLIIGTPIAGRNHDALKDMVGVFINMLPIRSNPAPDKKLTSFIKEVQQRIIAAFDNQEYPFEDMLRQMNTSRDNSRNPLFDVALNVIRVNGSIQAGEIAENNRHRPCYAKLDLMITVHEYNNGITIEFEYKTSLFTAATIDRFLVFFKSILQTIAGGFSGNIANMSLPLGKEGEELLQRVNNTWQDISHIPVIHDLLKQQAIQSPHQVALICGHQQLTYQQLNSYADNLAVQLQAAGAQPDQLIGILMDRSVEMMVAIFAVLKAGAAYVPLNPDYPSARIADIITDSGMLLMLVSPQYADRVHASCREMQVQLSGMAHTGVAPLQVATRDNLAYAIYTSGSTGKPKCIMVKHHNLVNFYAGLTTICALHHQDKCLALTTICFDIFIAETLVPLAQGATVIIASVAQQKDPVLLAQLIIGSGITFMQITPAHLTGLFDSTIRYRNLFEGIKTMLVGGEAFPPSLLAKLRPLYKGRLYNMYGPTETTVWSTYDDLTASDTITIGRPLANTRIYIMSDKGQQLPVGIFGELCIGGDGVSAGYFNNPTLTASKFVNDPLAPGERLYKTGDRARFLPNGKLEFQGRIDHQVKIRGFRVEPAEITACLLKSEMIREAVVVAVPGAPDEYQLVAYYVAAAPVMAAEIRAYLSTLLPDYLVPAFFVPLEEMPLNPNRKIDRSRLPPVPAQTTIELIAPRNDIENRLAGIWKELLNVEVVDIYDNFFSLGGHSLLAARLVFLISKEFGVNLTVPDIMESPDIATLAGLIGKNHPVNEVAQTGVAVS